MEIWQGSFEMLDVDHMNVDNSYGTWISKQATNLEFHIEGDGRNVNFQILDDIF